MKRSWILIALLAALAVTAAPGPLAASNQIAKETGLVCTACHDKPGSKLLTDRGKYYELMGSLDGFDQLTGTFGRCTFCHVRKPGSDKLTREGRKLAEVAGSMEELRQWLAETHPQPPAEGEEGEPAEESGGGAAAKTAKPPAKAEGGSAATASLAVQPIVVHRATRR